MLKIKLNKTEYDALPEGIKSEYSETGDDYVLQVEGVKTQADIDKVMEAKNQEKRLRKEAEDRLKEREHELATLGDKVNAYESDSGKKLTAEERVEMERLKRELETRSKTYGELEQKYGELEKTHTQDKIRMDLLSQAKGIMREDAINDTVEQLLNKFVISEGKVLTCPELGDKSGLEAKAYLASYVEGRSYLAPTSTGGGAGGGGGSGGGSRNDKAASMKDIVEEAWKSR